MPENRIIQIINLTPATTTDHIKTLFGYFGRVEDVCIYPEAEYNFLLIITFVTSLILFK